MNRYILKLVIVFLIIGVNTFKSYSSQTLIDDNGSLKRDFEVTTTDVGSIPSSYSNSPSGGLVYTIPIEVYPGRDNFQPSINLTYNSQTLREGVAGLGWNIGGLSSIERTNANQYYNQTVGSAGFHFEGRFLYNLDGLRLLIEPEETFVTEQGNIKLDYTKEENAFFKALYPNGNIAYFGINEGQERDKTISFPITKKEDIKGNYIKYFYTKSDNIYYIREIQYGLKDQINPLASVKFMYETKNVTTPLYFDGEEILQNKLLSGINIYYQAVLLKSYKLTYDKGAVNYFTQLDLLTGDYLFERFEPLHFSYDYTDKLDVTVKTDTLKNYNMQPSESFAENRVNAFSLKTEIKEPHRGLVVYPMKSSYTQHKYGYASSQYLISDTAYIYKDIRYNDQLPDKLPLGIFGQNFRGLINLDIDGSGVEKLVKIYSLDPESDAKGETLIFKVYNSDLTESSEFKIETQEALFKVNKNGAKTINARNKTFLNGDFRGIGKQELLLIVHSDDFNGDKHGSQAILVSPSEQRIVLDFPSFDVEATDILMSVDFDSDGKTDIVHINKNGLYIYNYSSFGVKSFNLVASTDAVNSEDLYLPPSSGRSTGERTAKNTMTLGDINGDGYVDILISPDQYYGCRGACDSLGDYPDYAKQWTILYAKGKNKGFEKQVFPMDLVMGRSQELFFQDVKGNGFPYLFVVKTGQLKQFESDLEVFENKNGRLSKSSIYKNKDNYSKQFVFSDIQNIKEPVFMLGLDYSGCIKQYNLSMVSNLMATSTNSLGVETKYNYGNLLHGDTHQVTGDQLAFPYNKFIANVNILSGITSSYQGKEIESKKYRYQNAVLHRQGLGFRGFEKVSLTNNIVDKTITQIYDPTEQSTLKEELIYQNVYKTRKQTYFAVFEYIEGFYNTNRRHSHLEYLTIKEFNELHKFKQLKIA